MDKDTRIKRKLPCCPVCKHEPYVHSGTVHAFGCTAHLWMVECSYEGFDEDQSKTPFMEHSFCIYGSTKEEAEHRWKEIAARA